MVRVNMDMKVLIDWEIAFFYLTKYMNKTEETSHALNEIIDGCSATSTVNGTICEIIMKAMGKRDMSIQEVASLIHSN